MDNTKLLILTNSIDGTCDSMVRIMKETEQVFFRWNIDLWQEYETKFDGTKFFLTDPVGRTMDATASDVCLLWRKPFINLMNFDETKFNDDDKEQARSQIRQWLLSLVATMRPQGRVRLIEPYADRRLPKLYQLQVAQSFFAVPISNFSIHKPPLDFDNGVISKPLGDLSIGECNVLYTTKVNGNELYRPFPWFVQKAIIGGTDITCVYILGRSHFYESEFQRGESSIDWRVEINTETESSWHIFSHDLLPKWQNAVNNYMKQMNLHYGRLDFILKDNILYFLECNTNGQFGWLDNQDSWYLHREFIAATFNPDSTVI